MTRLVLLTTVYLCFLNNFSWALKSSDTSACLKNIKPLEKKRDVVAELDGIWGLFQKVPEFQSNSVQGINLDKKISAMLFNLDYLCNTLDGIPFDELSDYVSKSLVEKGKKKFRQELLILGRSAEEIDIWFEFSQFAVENRHRILNPKTVSDTINNSDSYLNQYLKLAKEINRKQNLDSILKKTKILINQIDSFFKFDPYLSKAIYENSRVPYVDWDENHGGS